MPELPEVETVMRGLRLAMEGRRISAVEVRRPDLRFPFPAGFAERLRGKRVEALARRAKYITAGIEGGEMLLMHLGMTGRFTVVTPAGKAHNLGEFYDEAAAESGNGKHDHVRFSLDDGTSILYSDPRRFGLMDLFPQSEAGEHKLLRDIGIEPLGNGFNAEVLARTFAGKAAPLKAALLDQKIIAGLGNIYVCEALFRARLSPSRKARSLVRRGRADARLESLVRHIRDVLNEAIAAGGSTLRDYALTDGSRGGFQQTFAVYDREGENCLVCARPVRRFVQSGRSTFHCSNCQR